MAKQYQIIGMGGTFDHFHVGHQHFLDFAAGLAKELYVGITTDTLIQTKKLVNQIEPYEVRAKAVTAYLTQKDIKHQIFPLTDIFGPTLENSPVEAIAVTELTKKGGEMVNAERQRRNLGTLPIHVCDVLKDETGEYISSTRIRSGVMNRQGRVYKQLFSRDLVLSSHAREKFREKQGALVKSPQESSRRYVAGDIVLQTFINHNWPFQLGVYDQRSNQQALSSIKLPADIQQFVVSNPAGQITKELANQLDTLQHTKVSTVLKVDGEEDLAAVALVLLAPLGTAIYYGQPNEGMVEMIVTEELKEKFYGILSSN